MNCVHFRFSATPRLASELAAEVAANRSLTAKRFAGRFSFLWAEMDSNHRSRRQQIYSLPHLATLVSALKIVDQRFALPGKRDSGSAMRRKGLQNFRIFQHRIRKSIEQMVFSVSHPASARMGTATAAFVFQSLPRHLTSRSSPSCVNLHPTADISGNVFELLFGQGGNIFVVRRSLFRLCRRLGGHRRSCLRFRHRLLRQLRLR